MFIYKTFNYVISTIFSQKEINTLALPFLWVPLSSHFLWLCNLECYACCNTLPIYGSKFAMISYMMVFKQKIVRNFWCYGRYTCPTSVAKTYKWRENIISNQPREGCWWFSSSEHWKACHERKRSPVSSLHS